MLQENDSAPLIGVISITDYVNRSPDIVQHTTRVTTLNGPDVDLKKKRFHRYQTIVINE